MSGGPLALAVHTKQALAVTAAVSLVLAGAGAGAILSYEPPPEQRYDPYEPTEHVPADVDYVGTLEPESFREHPATENATRASLRFQQFVEFYDGPKYTRALAVSPPPNASLNVSNASHVTYYGRHGSNYRARLVVANWTGRETAEALGARLDTSYERRTYRNLTLYESERGSAVAVLDDGDRGGPVPETGRRLLAVGNATAVREAVDVRAARAAGEDPETVDGELLRRYRDTEDGYVRYAFAFRPDTVPDYRFVGPAVQSIRYVGTAYQLNRTGVESGAAPNMTVRIRITSEEADSADDVRNIMSLGVGVYQVRSSNRTLKREFRRVALGVDDRTVTVDHTTTPQRLRILLRGLVENEPERQGALAPPDRARTAGGPDGARGAGA